jgi:hypothetical protein
VTLRCNCLAALRTMTESLLNSGEALGNVLNCCLAAAETGCRVSKSACAGARRLGVNFCSIRCTVASMKLHRDV